MRPRSTDRAIGSFWLATALLIAAGPGTARAQNYGVNPATVTSAAASSATTAAQATPEAKPTFEIYGFAMLDIGQDFGRINPNWSDTLRLTKLPSFDKQYGEDGNAFAGVRQSRFGVKSSTPTPIDGVTLKTVFEFELFGTGVDEGQTTFRLRHAYGEFGHFLAGQTWSPFMDPDVFPNTVEYLGPDRHGALPQRPVPLHDGRQRPAPGDVRARAARRQRRSGRLCRSRRAGRHFSADPLS